MELLYAHAVNPGVLGPRGQRVDSILGDDDQSRTEAGAAACSQAAVQKLRISQCERAGRSLSRSHTASVVWIASAGSAWALISSCSVVVGVASSSS